MRFFSMHASFWPFSCRANFCNASFRALYFVQHLWYCEYPRILTTQRDDVFGKDVQWLVGWFLFCHLVTLVSMKYLFRNSQDLEYLERCHLRQRCSVAQMLSLFNPWCSKFCKIMTVVELLNNFADDAILLNDQDPKISAKQK